MFQNWSCFRKGVFFFLSKCVLVCITTMMLFCVFISLHVCIILLFIWSFVWCLPIGELFENATSVIGTWKRVLKSYLPSLDEEVCICWSPWLFLTFVVISLMRFFQFIHYLYDSCYFVCDLDGACLWISWRLRIFWTEFVTSGSSFWAQVSSYLKGSPLNFFSCLEIGVM